VYGDQTDPQAYNVYDAQFPASDPWATAVGGTSLAIGRDGSVVGDYAWGDDYATVDAAGTGYTQAPPGIFQEGSGGGVSTYYAEPGYQKAAVPSALATDGGSTAARRTIPDISADAGESWLIGYTGLESEGVYNEQPVGGGTSASSPFVAGLEADAMQAAGHALGFADPAVYCLEGGSAIRDILPVNPADPPILDGAQTGYGGVDTTQLVTLGEDATLTPTPGFDDATGLGAPTASFVADLSAAVSRG
jgi:subtilase family serine protease